MPMSFRAHLVRIWRRRLLIAAITLLAGLVAFGATVRHSGTRYTGTATLITVSQNGSPDQIAVLATGYVATFIQPSYQDMLRARLGLPADVSLTAQTAAGSQIISISATAPDEATAQRAAGAAADEFLREVNASLQADRDNLIAQMRSAVKADTQSMTDSAMSWHAEIDMQQRINGVNADTTNDLQILQSDAGVTAKSSGAKRTIAVALVGGLIFGCLLAWVLGAASRRLSDPAELMEKARIEPLVVIPSGGGTMAELQRERQLRQLAATVALLDVPKPAVVAVAAVERMPGTDEIAESLARYRADHGARTVLVHADGAPAPLDAVEGDIESVAVRWLLASSESGGRMREVFLVSDPQDVHGPLGMEHLGKLVTSLRSRADLIVIQSPAVSESAESYMVCAVADRTLLVAVAGSSADSVLAARDQMERVGVSLLGVAFVERSRRDHAESGSNDRTTTVSGPDAPNRPSPTPSATWATSHNGDVGSRLMDMGATAPVDDRTARSMGSAVPAARQVTTGDTGEETGDETGDEALVFVKGPDTDDRSWESAAAPDTSSTRLDETTSSVDPKSGADRA
jgi:capsular polysaccharide biosynthesis protein